MFIGTHCRVGVIASLLQAPLPRDVTSIRSPPVFAGRVVLRHAPSVSRFCQTLDRALEMTLPCRLNDVALCRLACVSRKDAKLCGNVQSFDVAIPDKHVYVTWPVPR